MKLDSNFIAFCKQSIALEQRMAKQAGKRLNEAMRNNIQDINVLDRIRNNAARKQELDTLNGRYFPSFEPQNEDMYITLATRRDQVDFINEKKLAELPGEEYVSVGKIEGDFPESSLPTQLNLSIKEQAQVIFIDND